MDKPYLADDGTECWSVEELRTRNRGIHETKFPYIAHDGSYCHSVIELRRKNEEPSNRMIKSFNEPIIDFNREAVEKYSFRTKVGREAQQEAMYGSKSAVEKALAVKRIEEETLTSFEFDDFRRTQKDYFQDPLEAFVEQKLKEQLKGPMTIEEFAFYSKLSEIRAKKAAIGMS